MPNYNNVSNPKVRKQYGYLGGFVGLLSNIILFIVKLILGILINSISLIADSFNNLSDIGSSVITLLGFKLADKPPDKEHPFGHGRTEYISALIVSLVIVLVGFQLIQSSFSRIRNPEEINFNFIGIIILFFTIGIKFWMGLFNKKLGVKINSKSLVATAADSMNDVLATSAVVLSILLSYFLPFPIDGFMGMIVAIIIIYSGISMAKDTLNPLLGQAPSSDLIDKITKTVLRFDGIEGVHDLVVHDYGPGRTMATLHAEVSSTLSPLVAHEIIDEAERKIAKDLNVYIVIHTDPININCPVTNVLKEQIETYLTEYPQVLSIHDFRVVEDKNQDSILFDAVVGDKLKDEEILTLKKEIKYTLKKELPQYAFIITFERQHAFIH